MSNIEENDYESRLLDSNGIIELLEQATKNNTSLSLARFGHGEINIGCSSYPEWILGWQSREYTGATGSPKVLQKEIQNALRMCNIAGFHQTSSKNKEDRKCAILTKKLLRELMINPPYVCNAWITHDFIKEKRFWEWLGKHKVFLVGRRAKEAAAKFKNKGIKVVGTATLEGFDQIQPVCDSLSKKSEWEVALISAGIPATILSPKLAKASGRVVIDFGHAMDVIVDRQKFNHNKKVEEFNIHKKKR